MLRIIATDARIIGTNGAIEQHRVLVNLRQDYAAGFYALGEVLSQKGLRKEAAAASRNYLAKENDTPDAHQRIRRARARLKELDGWRLAEPAETLKPTASIRVHRRPCQPSSYGQHRLKCGR